MIVLDASTVIELLLRTPAGLRVAYRIENPDETLHAPELIDLEVTQVLRRYCSMQTLSPRRARIALDDLQAMSLRRYAHGPLIDRIWALHATMTAYDAAYVALAEVLGAPLLTLDGRLQRAPGTKAEIELI